MPDHSVSSDRAPDGAPAEAPIRPAPLLAPTLGLILGLALEAWAPVTQMWHYVLLLGAAGQLFLGRHAPGPRRAGLFLAGLACGLALHAADYRPSRPDHLATLLPHRPVLSRLRGLVAAPPGWTKPPAGPFYTWSSGRYRTRLLLEVQAVEASGRWRTARGLVPVSVDGLITGFESGDIVEVFGRLRPIRPAANPGQRDWRLFNQRRGIFAALNCSSPQAVRVLESGAGAGWVHSLRSAARRLVLPEMYALDDQASTLVESVVLGQRSRVGPALNQAFARTGTSHYLSASGLHVGMLAGFVWLLSAMFGLRRRGRALLILVVVMLYALVAEPRAPILRAATITVLFCISVLLHRAVHALNWISVAAFIVLVLRPCDLFSAGFQLSFLVVLGIIYLAPHVLAGLKALWPERFRRIERLGVSDAPPGGWQRWGNRFGRGLLYALAVALAAWCSALLVVAWHFHQVAPWGWLNSLLLMPLAFGVMICGFLRAVVGLLWPLAAEWMGPVLDMVTRALAGAVRWLSQKPGATLAVCRPPIWLILVAAAAAVYLVWLGRRPAQVPPGRLRLWRLSALVILGIALVALLWPLPSAPDGLTAEVLAVGDGLAAVIRLPDGRTLLYDAGSLSFSDPGRSVVVPALAHFRVDALDAVFLSHLNLDHYNGLPTVLDAVPTAGVLLSTYSPRQARPHSAGARLLSILAERNLSLHTLAAGDLISPADGVTCRVLWPPDADAGPDLSTNESSLVLRLEHAGRSLLLCGDIGPYAQKRLMAHPHLAADVLVLPHHGSVVATTRDFLRAVSPAVVVRSSGRPCGPWPDPLVPLLAGRPYYNTADNGAVRIRLHRGEVSVSTFRGSSADGGRRRLAE